jgi:hypothetical protein
MPGVVAEACKPALRRQRQKGSLRPAWVVLSKQQPFKRKHKAYMYTYICACTYTNT